MQTPIIDSVQWIDLISIVFSITALVISVILFVKTRHYEKYKIVDDRLFAILEANLQHPDFNDINFISGCEAHPAAKTSREYEIYAMMVWNYLELIFDYFGPKKIKKLPFWGAFEYWSGLHYSWFLRPDINKSYSSVFIKFVNEIQESKPSKSKTTDTAQK